MNGQEVPMLTQAQADLLQLEDFLALIQMQCTGVYPLGRLAEIRERQEAREARRRVP